MIPSKDEQIKRLQARVTQLSANIDRGKKKYREVVQRMQIAIGQRNSYKTQVLKLQLEIGSYKIKVTELQAKIDSYVVAWDFAAPGTSCRTVRAMGEPVHVANELCDLGEQCRCKTDNNGDCWNSKVGKV